jgi:hypothetical protein
LIVEFESGAIFFHSWFAVRQSKEQKYPMQKQAKKRAGGMFDLS